MATTPKITVTVKAEAAVARHQLVLARLRAHAGSSTTDYLHAAANAAIAGVTPEQIEQLAAAHTTGLVVLKPEHTDRLPVWCWLRGHTWHRSPIYGSWTRRTCHRCAHLNPAHP